MFGIGPMEMVIVGIVAVLLFGSRLPSVARSLGKSMTEFKKGMRDFENEMHNEVYSDPPPRVTYDTKVEDKSPEAGTTGDATGEQSGDAPGEEPPVP